MTSPHTLASLGITGEMIQTYDQRVPRYTSYPTAPYFNAAFGPSQWAEHVRVRSPNDTDVSLYVHIPFCRKRCLFCACNVIITRKDWLADQYLDYVEKEVANFREHYRGAGRCVQLHLGGGTPNFLDNKQMARLLAILQTPFHFAEGAERSIEVDPRASAPETIHDLFHEHGFNRISFGVQDFHADTQEAVGREQSVELTFNTIKSAREAGFKSVNFDFIYGLPRQTVASWRETLDAICRLRPDRLAIYNFAFLPTRMSNQRGIRVEELPSAEVKLDMFIEAHNRLTSEGWVFIGMDHYALEGDTLTKAMNDGTLRRNFMGYNTLRETDMIAFGVSAISDYEGAYSQNVKKLSEYYRLLDAGELPVERGLLLSDDDRRRRYVIEELMCNGRLRLDGGPELIGGHAREMVQEEFPRLEALQADGLISIGANEIRVTEKGRLFLRNIAAVFDAYLAKASEKPLYSRAL